MKCATILLAVAVATFAPSVSEARRIVGGQFAEEHQFPYQIGLFLDGNFRCGGSIIDSQWILTASHCVLDGVDTIPAKGFQVHVGSANLEQGQLYAVAETFAHEKYGSFQNDIALIKLQDKLEFSEGVQPIELNTVELPVDTPVIISGYGRIGDGQPISEQLKYNTAFVESKEICRSLTGLSGKGLICFKSPADNGACNGDSGGPAAHNDKLVGVANFVLQGCGTQYPDGYAEVAYYVDWINEIMQKN